MASVAAARPVDLDSPESSASSEDNTAAKPPPLLPPVAEGYGDLAARLAGFDASPESYERLRALFIDALAVQDECYARLHPFRSLADHLRLSAGSTDAPQQHQQKDESVSELFQVLLDSGVLDDELLAQHPQPRTTASSSASASSAARLARAARAAADRYLRARRDALAVRDRARELFAESIDAASTVAGRVA
ncbi:hypothetical protein HK405_012514, partial [Cladochytrium tenue]